MIIDSYTQALSAIGMKASDIEVQDIDLTPKPTDFLRKPAIDSWAERAILDRQAPIHFE